MKEKNVFSRLGLSLFLMLVLGMVSSGVLMTLLPTSIKGVATGMLSNYVGMYLLGLPVLWLLTKKTPKATKQPKEKMSGLNLLKNYVLCLGGMYVVNISYTMIFGLLTGKNGNEVGKSISQLSLLSTFFIVVILAPIIEELIFRKLMYQLTADYGEKTYILVSGITFGLFHMNLAQGLYASWIGFVLAAVFYRTGNILYPIILHIVINFTGSMIPALIKDSQMGMTILSIFIFVVMLSAFVIGVIGFMKNRRKAKLQPGKPVKIPVKHVFLNGGMIVYFIFCLIIIVAGLLMS